ncbi:MAG: hypothetical protein IJ158_14495 [Treponema sp.]|nr:hypothetical protein [Treponema sp.]
METREVFQFYNDTVKILYSEIEARNNTLPVELLFEIHSAFDHLKRYFIDGESEDECCKKAFSHLKRGLLDAFKLKLKYFNDDCNKLLNKKADLRIIDSGTYLTDLLNDRKTIINTARTARLEESKTNIDSAFENWCAVSKQIDDFEAKYFDSAKIKWAEKQSFFHFNANFWLGVLAGVISSIAVTLLFQLF